MKDPLEHLSPLSRQIWIATYSAAYAKSKVFSYAIDRADEAVADFQAWERDEEIPSEQDDGYPM